MSLCGFDELLDFLLDKIALRGSEGASLENVSEWCKQFYSDETLHQSSAPLSAGGRLLGTQARSSDSPNVDALLSRKVFKWLIAHSDVQVVERAKGDSLVVAEDSQSQSLRERSVPALAQSRGQAQVGEDAVANVNLEPMVEDSPPVQYLKTTEDRIWISLTGHGPDFTRIKALEFQLLVIIAGFGERGVTHPDLIAASGQDKRSLPKRTDELHTNGYIEKKPVLAHGTRTSLCTLTRFIKKTSKLAAEKGTGFAEDEEDCFRDGMLISDVFYDKTMRIVEDFGIITQSDLRRLLDVVGKQWQSKATFRSLRIMDRLGCVKRVSAPAVNRLGKQVYIRCIKYLGDLGEEKRQEFIVYCRKGGQMFKDTGLDEEDDRKDAADAEDPDEADDLDETDAVLNPQDETDAVLNLQDENAASGSLTTRSSRIVPQADLKQTLVNYLHEIVEASGAKGISSMDLQAIAFGNFFKRPTEQFMSHITDVWQDSQPLQLRHLAVVRDATVYGKYSHYIYRTFDNFNKAVERDEASWDAINHAYQKIQKSKKKANATRTKNDLDAWGFPELDSHAFILSGPITMAACRLRYRTQGGKNRQNGADKSQGKRPIGRPRKYPRVGQTLEEFKAQLRTPPTNVKHPSAGSLDEGNFEGPPSKRPRITTSSEDVTSAASMINNPLALSPEKASNALVNNHLFGVFVASENTPLSMRDISLMRGKKRPASLDGTPGKARKHQKRGPIEEIIDPPPPSERASPGVYRLPPRRVNTRGRPRNNIVLVLKSKRIKDFEWFEASPDVDPPATTVSTITEGSAEFSTSVQPYVNSARVAFDKPDEVHQGPHSLNSAIANDSERTSAQPAGSHKYSGDHVVVAVPQTARAVSRGPEVGSPSEPLDGAPTSTQQPNIDVSEENIRHAVPIKQSVSATSSQPKLSLDGWLEKNQVTLTQNEKTSETTTDASSGTDQTALFRSRLVPATIPKSTQQEDRKQTNPPKRAPNPKRRGVTLGRGVAEFKKSKMILDIMTEAGGVYPGDREMWYPFTTALQKSGSSERPDPKTVARAVKNVVDSGKLKKFAFAFKGKGGAVTTKHILALPHVKSNSKLVSDLEKAMIDSEGKVFIYLPELPEVDLTLRMRANREIHPAAEERAEILPQDDSMPVLRRLPRIKPKKSSKPAWAAWAVWADSEEHQATLDTESSDDEDEEVSEHQAAMQGTFQLSIPAGAPRKKKFDRLASLNRKEGRKKPSSLYLSPYNSAPVPVNHFPNRRSATANSTATSTGDIVWEPVEIVEVQSPPRGHTSESRYPVSTAIVADKVSRKTPAAWLAQYMTLARPVQNFHPTSGTFGTTYSAPHKMRPQLRVQPHLLRAFEDRLPQSMEDIRERGGKGRRNLSWYSQIDREIKQVERWEQDNTADLTSNVQLVTPRFISYNLTMDARDLQPRRPSNPSMVEVRSASRALVPRSRHIQKSTVPVPRSTVRKNASAPRRVNRPSDTLDASLEKAEPRKKLRRNRTAPAFSEVQSQRFAAVVISVRLLTGGIDRLIDWDLVHRLFPGEYTTPLLKKRWTATQVNRRLQFAKLEREFQNSYINAVEEEILPLIDYDRPEEYEWDKVVDWAQRMMQFPASDIVPELPTSHYVLDDFYDVQMEKDPYEANKDDLYLLWSTQLRREELLSELTWSIPVQNPTKYAMTQDDAQLEIAKSFVRANVLTPATTYKPQVARERLLPLGTDMLDKALADLLASKTLKVENKGRLVPGRNYSINEQFIGGLKKQILDSDDLFKSAVDHKMFLDTAFSNDGSILIPPAVTDGHMLAIINLIAAGHMNVTLDIPPVTDMLAREPDDADAPRTMSLWGITEAHYKTKQLNRDHLQFPIRVSPTSTYTAGIPLLNTKPLPPPPALDCGVLATTKSIPLWYDIHDGLLPSMWEIVLSVVLTAVALRPGINAEDISKTTRRGVARFEVESALAWLDDLGVLKRLRDGWMVGEWWWAAFGGAGAGVGADAGASAGAGAGAGSDAAAGRREEDVAAAAAAMLDLRGAE